MSNLMIGVRRLVLAAAAILLVSSNAIGESRAWFVSLEGGAGRANETWEAPVGDVEHFDLTVMRLSMAGGVRYGRHVSGAVEISLVERGAQDDVRTVYRPEGEERRLFYERSYVDVALPVSYRFWLSEWYLAIGVAPRVSLLAEVRSPFSRTDYTSTLVAGVDPHVRVGYRWLYLNGRYLLDIARPKIQYGDSPEITVRDEVFSLGIGVEITP